MSVSLSPHIPLSQSKRGARDSQRSYTVQHVRWKGLSPMIALSHLPKSVSFLNLCYFPLDLCSSTNRICAKLRCCMRVKCLATGCVVEPKFLCPRHSVKTCWNVEFQQRKVYCKGQARREGAHAQRPKHPSEISEEFLKEARWGESMVLSWEFWFIWQTHWGFKPRRQLLDSSEGCSEERRIRTKDFCKNW